MRLPQQLVSSPLFQFSEVDDLIAAMGEKAVPAHVQEIERLYELGLPPIVSVAALSTMIGVNSGLIWSFINKPWKHYRQFPIPKGKGFRQIQAPRVGLKIVQKWMSVHISKAFSAPDHVFGFVQGRSHVGAAKIHKSAEWCYSVDIQNFARLSP